MKTFTRWLLALLLVAMPMMAAIQTASANSELVPASRLIAPYITNSTSATAPVAGQATFLLLSNVTWTGGPTAAVNAHLEFYDKTCARTNRTMVLSAGDTDQFNVTSTITMATGHGWVDIDVRSGSGGLADTSTQQNQLVGSVLISDATNDFAFSYPMAAVVGSARTGATGSIVTRNASGNAVTWTGRYEPLPTRIVVPVYFAEQTASPAVTGFLAVAAPADGNWYGQGALSTSCTTATGCGESPGEDLGTSASVGNLISAGTQVWDGCEHAISAPQAGHYVSGTLQGLFGSLLNRTAWGAGSLCTSGAGGFPQSDVDSTSVGGGGPIGWVDFPNTATTKRGIAFTGTARARGLVGVFFESSVGTSKQADATRLWGDRASINTQTGCTTSSNTFLLDHILPATGPCTYNIIDSKGNPTSQP